MKGEPTYYARTLGVSEEEGGRWIRDALKGAPSLVRQTLERLRRTRGDAEVGAALFNLYDARMGARFEQQDLQDERERDEILAELDDATRAMSPAVERARNRLWRGSRDGNLLRLLDELAGAIKEAAKGSRTHLLHSRKGGRPRLYAGGKAEVVTIFMRLGASKTEAEGIVDGVTFPTLPQPTRKH